MFGHYRSLSGYKHAEKHHGHVLVAAVYLYKERFGFSSHLNQYMDIIDFLKSTAECYVIYII
jgi:hypothetical protein